MLIGETSSIREEELKNRVAALFFGKYDCTRIVGNIDFCVMVKRHECRFSEGRPHVGEAALSPLHESHLYWAEAKNHPTDIYRMLAQLILTIGRAGRPRPDAAGAGRPPYQGDLFAATGESSAGGSRSSATAAETAAHHAGATSCAPPASVPLCLCVKENLSPAARAVLDAGRELWRYYHAQPGANPNASYYDIRAHFQGCKPNGTMNTTSADVTYSALLVNLRSAHKALAAQIEPKVYEYGFLKR